MATFLSTDDTDAHHDWAEAHWWPALRARYPRPGGGSARRLAGAPDPSAAAAPSGAGHPNTPPVSTSTCSRGRAAWAWVACSSSGCWATCERVACRRCTWSRTPPTRTPLTFYEHLGFTVLARLPDDTVMGLHLDR